MGYATAKRISDGLLGWTQSFESAPDQDKIILNMGVNVLGGVSGDYVYQELSEEQNTALVSAKPARSKLVDGVLTHATPISASLSAGTVEADGITEITLNIHTHDTAYNGQIKVSVLAPSGESQQSTVNAVFGQAAETFTTELTGVHQITVETVLHGLAFASFEGVA